MPSRHIDHDREPEPDADRERELRDDPDLTPQDRWSHVYYAGRRDGAAEMKAHTRFASIEVRVTAIENTMTSAKHYLLGLAVAAAGQIGLLLVAIVGHYLMK